MAAGLPTAAVDAHLALAPRDQVRGHHHDDVVDGAHAHARVAPHGGVHRIARQVGAVDVVAGLDGHRADDVGGVDVEAPAAPRLQVRVHLVPQEDPDVPVDRVPRRVLLPRGHVLLARALGHRDHHEVLPGQCAVDVRQYVLHLHIHLGDQHQVHDRRRQRRVHGHEAGVAAYQLQDAHTALRARRLDPSVPDHIRGRRHRGLKAEGLLEDQDVVVDGVRHTHHAQPHPAALRLLVQYEGRA
mmetsp:Transcript_72628/g.203938  ORF Transcript_72628/g.203938 Transcript_72628/m.203938 type:complete len:242 (-) Transcript_72628:247-972(-)